ncbi:MAG: 50S ribosomal protein L18 [Opitutales bacterium]|nr:50S ribosomal protein L18 [Opitutales bacterium]
MHLQKKQKLRTKRIWRIRKKVSGTPERPRLCVSFTNKHIYAQVIDDTTGRTLAAASSVAKELKDASLLPNIEGARKVGQLAAENAKKAGIELVVFDRHGKRYHGRTKAFADAAREAGLNF